MIFEVERTSQWNHWYFDEDKPPCDGAFVKEFEITKTTRNGLAVKKKIKRWFIELNTLDDLLAFKEENVGELIITYSNLETVEYRMEIYDIPKEW